MDDMFQDIMKKMQADYDELDIPVCLNHVICQEFMMEMPDGIRLRTFLYRECGGKKNIPVIVQRTPYLHAFDTYKMHAENIAKRGFGYILQFCRGTGGSEGEWIPNINERKDGITLLQWLEEQEWVESVGYWGDSYLALTGWCMADEVPKKVKGMYLGVYGTDRFTSAYEKRMFRQDVLTSWAMENAGYENRGR